MQNNRNYTRLFWALLITFLAIFLISPIALDMLWARPGGGHSFSGGGGSGGSGGGDIGALIYLLMELPPEISIPVIIAIIAFKIIQNRRRNSTRAVTSSPTVQNRVVRNNQLENNLDYLIQQDPNFSKVVFLDFAASLFHKYYTWFGKPEFRFIAPFFSPKETQLSENQKNTNQTNSEIVIGAINVTDIVRSHGYDRITLEIDANYTNTHNGKASRFTVYERWQFLRKSGLISPAPERMRSVACPNCGAVSSFTDNADCSACGTHLTAGEQQWYVSQTAVLDRKAFSVAGLGHYAQERGTDYPTVYQTGLQNTQTRFAQRAGIDSQLWKSDFLQTVVNVYFMKIYAAWSINRLLSVRNLLSDRLYESFEFWINSYKQAGLVNKLEQIKISDIQIVKVEPDNLYDSVTVRIFASALDYVSDSQGNIKGGSNRKARVFSEYWTFIRRAGVKKQNFDTATCPSCSAPADNIGQAGECGYCGNKISNGEFSWVLAIIAQDEVYGG